MANKGVGFFRQKMRKNPTSQHPEVGGVSIPMYLKTVDAQIFDGKVEKSPTCWELMVIYHGFLSVKIHLQQIQVFVWKVCFFSMSLYIPDERKFLHKLLVGGLGYVPGVHPRRLKIEPENHGLEDDFPLPWVYSQVSC